MRAFIIAMLMSSSAYGLTFMDLFAAGEAMTKPLSGDLHIGGSGWWDKKDVDWKDFEPDFYVETYTHTICPEDRPCYTIVTRTEYRKKTEEVVK